MPIPGTVWGSDTWTTDAWAADTWEDAGGGGGDVTAPTLSSPTGSATGETTAQGSVDTDEGNGTLYFVVTESATAPSVAQVQAGQDHTGSAAPDSGNQAVSASGQQDISASGLTADTTYYIHYQHQDAATNDSSVVSSSSFDTLPTPSSPGSSSQAGRRRRRRRYR